MDFSYDYKLQQLTAQARVKFQVSLYGIRRGRSALTTLDSGRQLLFHPCPISIYPLSG
jgi:hypothetical protein